MLSLRSTDSVYVSATIGVHDRRWVEALRTIGYEPAVVTFPPDNIGISVYTPPGEAPDAFYVASTPAELRDFVTALSDDGKPVLAGPLDTVTRHLVGLPTRIVGLSWGYDLHDLEAAGEDMSWLAQLDGLIVDSEATASIATAHGVDPARITLLPWGVDLDIFTPDGPNADRSAFGIPADARIVLTLRAHEPIYRVGDVLTGFASIAKMMPDAVLVVGHDGSLTDELREQASALGVADRTHFIGRVDEAELPALLRTASCYVTASEVDGTSVTLLQAMACGTPVVASDTPGNRGWVQPGVTGRLFGVGDTGTLGEEIVAALGDHDDTMRTAALADVRERANWKTNIVRLVAALR